MTRFCSQNGTYEPHGRPRHHGAAGGAGEWIVFDLQQEESIAKVRLVNYWSSNDSWSFKDLTIETAPALGGPFTPVAAFAGLPRCSESKAVDLYLEGEEEPAGRFWRVRCTVTHGGGAFGIYGYTAWTSGERAQARCPRRRRRWAGAVGPRAVGPGAWHRRPYRTHVVMAAAAAAARQMMMTMLCPDVSVRRCAAAAAAGRPAPPPPLPPPPTRCKFAHSRHIYL